jgi:acetyltransferase
VAQPRIEDAACELFLEGLLQMLSADAPLDRREWVADLTTQAGVALHIRPAVGSDLEMLRAFFGTVSVEDLKHRFSDAVDEAANIDLSAMVADRDPNCVTFLAFDHGTALIACATLSDAPEGDTAEVALSVDQEAKGKGVSWTLLEHVLSYARNHGLKLVTSLESGDDRTAINLEREMGFVARLSSANPVEVSLSKVVGDA